MIDIRPNDFDDFIDAPLSLVQFTAVWCGPCKSIAPHMLALSQQYGDRIRFGKFNIDSDKSIMHEYGVRSVPTLMLFSNGRPLGAAIVGAVPKAQIEAFLQKHAGTAAENAVERPEPRPVDPRVAAAIPRRVSGWRGRR